MLASIRHCSSSAGCLSEPLAGMEMRSDKTGELKKRWGREKKAQLEPPEWLDSIGWEFNSSGSQLSSRPCASRKTIKDAIRSILKDESEGLLWLSLCLYQFSFFSVVQLWRFLTCYCRWWRARQTEGRAWLLVESALIFQPPQQRCQKCVLHVPAGYMTCSRIGSSGVSNFGYQGNVIIICVDVFSLACLACHGAEWLCYFLQCKCHLKITSLIMCNIFNSPLQNYIAPQ